jgi:hypothetical protein
MGPEFAKHSNKDIAEVFKSSSSSSSTTTLDQQKQAPVAKIADALSPTAEMNDLLLNVN